MDAQSFMKLLNCRRSIRKFDSRPVEPEKVTLLLESVRLAPSSCNTQPWHIVVVDRPELIRSLSRFGLVGTRVNKWMDTAPLVFVLCGNPHLLIHKAAQWVDKDCHRMDVAIAGQQMCLMATALELGSCWIGWFSQEKIRSLLHIPESYHVLALLVVGYPADDIKISEPVNHGSRRKSLNEIASFNHFGEDSP